MVVIKFSGKRFLTASQATELKDALLAANSKVFVEIVSNKEMVVTMKDQSIKVMLACGSSNFIAGAAKSTRLTRAERAEARRRAMEVAPCSEKAAASPLKGPEAVEEPEATKVEEELEEMEIMEETCHSVDAPPAAAPPAAAAVDADGDGPLTQLWYGAFDEEIKAMLEDYRRMEL